MGTYRDLIVAANPDVYWRFQETSGTTVVDEMGLYNGTYSGTVRQNAWVSGRFTQRGTDFTGANGAALAPNTTLGNYGTGPFSVEFWVDNWYLANWVRKGNASDGWFLGGGGTGGAKFSLYSSSGSNSMDRNFSLPNAVPGYLRHYVFTYDGTGNAGAKLYHEGEAVAPNTTNGTPVTASDSFSTTGTTLQVMGVSLGGYTPYGILVDFAMYPRALGVEEVRAHKHFAPDYSSRTSLTTAQVHRSVSRPAKNLVPQTAASSGSSKRGAKLMPGVG